MTHESVTTGAVEIGQRVFLRPAWASDRAAFVALRRASRSEFERWEPEPAPGVDPFGDRSFDREISVVGDGGECRWLICRVGDGALVGRVTLGTIERGPFQNGRLGYWIGTEFSGRGYMTEAIGLVLRRAFGVMGLHRVCANIMPSNVGSRRVLERNGFVREGYSEKYLQIAGVWADHERWAITAEMDRTAR